MIKKQLIAFLLLFCSAVTAVCTSFTHYTLSNENGLASSSPICIYQDSRDFLWIGTWNGLNVFDGHSFGIYRYKPNDANSISDNVIMQIDEEDEGIIWASTTWGINRIDVTNKIINRFYVNDDHNSPFNGKSYRVAVSKDHRVFCSVSDVGIAYYDKSTGKLVPFNIPKYNSNLARCIYTAGNNKLVILGTDNSVIEATYSFDNEGNIRISAGTRLIPGKQIILAFGCKYDIFFVSSDNYIYRYDKGEHRISESGILTFDGAVKSISENEKRDVTISLMSLKTYNYYFGKKAPEIINEFTGKKIEYLYYGTQGILWAGVNGEGLEAYYENRLKIDKFLNTRIDDSFRSPVTSMCSGPDGIIYIGTQGNGMYTFVDGKASKKYGTSNGIANPVILALLRWDENTIFIGNENPGFDVFSIKTGKFSHVDPLPERPFSVVTSMYKDSEHGYLWIGTIGKGTFRLKLKREGSNFKVSEQLFFDTSQSKSHTITSNTVVSFANGGKDCIWAGTLGGGLNKINTITGKITSFMVNTHSDDHISSNNVLDIIIGRENTIWLGTSEGINKMTKDAKGNYHFNAYTEKDGLPDNTVHAILSDRNGNIWFSTNRGIGVLNTSTGKVTAVFNNPTLQDNEFTNGACLEAEDGHLYFGGIKGFNYFMPQQIATRSYEPKVIINKFNVRQKPLPDFNPKDKIILKHNENFFSIDFTALEYIGNENCEYSYCLKGFNNEWVDIGTDHTAIFTNVPPGKYIFMVRCTNGDKIQSGKTTTLMIIVRHPWWNSIPGYLLYIIIISAIAFVIWKMVKKRIEEHHKMEMESLSKLRESETYEAKLRFFTNIAHEFGTPLTLICGSSDQLMDQGNLGSKSKKYVNIIRDSADRMQRLIQELMEFRKIDTGKFKLKYSKIEIVKMASKILDDFSEIDEKQKIILKTSFPSIDTSIVSDKEALEKIIFNLISNAYKYTPIAGTIYFGIEVDDGGTTMMIRNSGKGIKPENIDSIFDRFVILDNFEQQASQGKILRNGIGLALVQNLVNSLSGEINVSSERGKYTEFLVKLPNIPEENISVEESQEKSNEISYDGAQTGEEISENPSMAIPRQRIMIVDDEKQIRDLVYDILCDEYEVIPADDGKDAIKKIKFGLPDLIITDIIMPNLDGIGLLKFLKENELTQHIPIIFLTFKTDIEEETSSYELGSEAFIPKPFYTKHLIAVVHQILRNRTSLKKYYNSAISNADVYNDSTVDSEDKRFIMQLTNVIERNIDNENMSPSFLCEQMCVSKMQLYRKIKEIAAKTPSEFIRGIRISHSAFLLKTTNLTVLEIMFRSGFNYKSYFYREFAKVYKMSPKEYRDKNNGN